MITSYRKRNKTMGTKLTIKVAQLIVIALVLNLIMQFDRIKEDYKSWHLKTTFLVMSEFQISA